MRNTKILKFAAFLLAMVLIFNYSIGVLAHDGDTLPEGVATEETDSDIIKFDPSLYEDLKEGVDYVANEVIFEYKPEAPQEVPDDIETELKETYDLQELSTMGAENGTEGGQSNNNSNEEPAQETTYMATCEGDVIETIEAMNEDDNILYAEPNYYLDTCSEEDWPLDSENYGADGPLNSLALTSGGFLNETEEKSYQVSQIDMFNSMGLNMVWNAYTGTGVVIAVIDSGVDFTHPTLQGTNWQKSGDPNICGYDAALDSEININNISVNKPHGSMVAGVIAMQMDSENGYNCRGLAPNAKIMSCKTDDAYGYYPISYVCTAIEYAVANGADIINLSLGGPSFSNQLSNTCAKAARKAVLIAGAGNNSYEFSEKPFYPAAYGSVIGAMAYGGSRCAQNYDDTITTNKELLEHNYTVQTGTHYLADFSNTDGTQCYYDTSAPGVNICCPNIEGTGSVSGYTYESGTSFSSPIIACVVALYLQKYASNNVTPAQVRKAIRASNSNTARSYNSLISGEDDNVRYNRLMPVKMLRTPAGVPDASVNHEYTPKGTGDYTSFETYVRDYLAIDSGEKITVDDLTLIEHLDLNSDLLDLNIAQLEEFTHLLVINISDCNNLSSFWDMFSDNVFQRLFEFTIKDSNIGKFSSNANFAPNLNNINIINSKLIDISGLSNFPNLKVLNISRNSVTNLESLASCTKLERLIATDNYIHDISWLSNCSAKTIDIQKNCLGNLENLLKSKCETDALSLSYYPFKDNYVPSTTYELKEKTINRTSSNSKMDFEMYPVNSTVYAASWSINNPGAVKIDKYTGEIQIDQSLAATQITQNTNYTVTSSTYDGIVDSTTLHVVVPEIQNSSFEHYIIDNTNTYKFQVKTSLDTTKLKLHQTYTDNEEEKTVISEYTSGYTIAGDTKCWTIPYTETVHDNSTFTVTPGDTLGYMSPSAVTDGVQVMINNETVTSVTGQADELKISGFNDLSVSGNAFTSNTEIDNITIGCFKLTIAANAFNGCSSIDNVALLCNTSISTIAANAFNNCNNLNLYTTVDVSLPVNVINDFTVNNGVLTAYTGSGTNITIPDILGITEIGANAFHNKTTILSVALSDSVTNIGDSAFEGCTNLTTINTFENIEEIGTNAFKNCGLNMDIEFSDSLSDIGNSAFENSNISGVFFPSDVFRRDLADSVFKNCDKLSKVTLRDVKNTFEFGKYVFEDCSNLTELYFPRYIFFVSQYICRNCTNLTYINLPDTLQSINNSAFAFCSKLKINTFPSGLTIINDNAFKGCESLGGKLILSRTIQSIKKNAFTDCHIENIYILKQNRGGGASNSVYIHSEAFNNAVTIYANPDVMSDEITSDNITINEDFTFYSLYDGLSLISYNGNAPVVKIPEELAIEIIDKNVFKDNMVISDVTIPDTVTLIDDYAFSGCANLSKVNGMKGLDTLGDGAFQNCVSLVEMDLSNSIKSFESGVFTGCSGLERVKLAYNCDVIKEDCFKDLTSLKSIIIPNVSKIKTYAFRNCSNLRSVILPNRAYFWSDCFSGCDVKQITFYTNDDYNKEVIEMIGSNVFSLDFSIENGVFVEYNGLDKTFKIPEGMGITSIGENAFDSSDLEGIIIPNDITSLSDHVFSDCLNLTEVLVYGNISITGNPFFSSSSITIFSNGYSVTGTIASNITINNGFRILNNAITLYSGVETSPTFPAHLLIGTISISAFKGNTSITNITLPAGIERIETFAFEDCSNLMSVTFPDSLTFLGGRAFHNCTSLLTINFGSGNILIDREAFVNCISLTSVELSENTNKIKNAAFKNCSKLTSIYIPNSVTVIVSNSFLNCSPSLVIRCYENSVAHNFAVTNNIQYTLLT